LKTFQRKTQQTTTTLKNGRLIGKIFETLVPLTKQLHVKALKSSYTVYGEVRRHLEASNSHH